MRGRVGPPDRPETPRDNPLRGSTAYCPHEYRPPCENFLEESSKIFSAGAEGPGQDGDLVTPAQTPMRKILRCRLRFFLPGPSVPAGRVT